MRIGLWSDCHNFPSLPLMKLSAYHKKLGDEVEMYSILDQYDLVYASKTFSFTADIDDGYAVRADKLIKGGTGYCISVVDGIIREVPLSREIWQSNTNVEFQMHSLIIIHLIPKKTLIKCFSPPPSEGEKNNKIVF